MSWYLRRFGREHVVLERSRVAERWRSERWDSLMFQFPSWTIRLPGFTYEGDRPNEFMSRGEVVQLLEEYSRRVAPPLRCGAQVRALDSESNGNLAICTDSFALRARNVVVATGPYQRPAIPDCSAALPPEVFQVTANRYRNPDQLPSGAVLVVGSGASGCQIVEDLRQSGREVYLSVGRHRRVPRRYRGKDFGWWLETTGALKQPVEHSSPRQPAPLITGVNGGYDLNVRALGENGIALAGALRGIRNHRFLFADDVEENLASADRSCAEFARSCDEYAAAHGMEMPVPAASARSARSAPKAIRELDCREVSAVVWATGYRFDFGWIECPVLDEVGRPIHSRGVSAVPGLYFLGLPHLHALGSAFLAGVGDDAGYIAGCIAASGGKVAR